MKSLGRKKGSRLRLCFRVVDDVPEKKGMDLWKQMSSSKCSFTCICGIFLPLNPSTTTVYARSAFYPSLRFTLSLQSAFYTQSAFYPWSAVCSPQSAVFVLHWPTTKIRNFTYVVVYQKCYKFLIFQLHLKKLSPPLPAFRTFYHLPFSLQKILTDQPKSSYTHSSPPLPVVYTLNAAL